jgi:hypothetical protein
VTNQRRSLGSGGLGLDIDLREVVLGPARGVLWLADMPCRWEARDAPRREAPTIRPRRPIDQSAIKRFTPSGAEFDSVIDLRATSQQGRRDLSVDTMP